MKSLFIGLMLFPGVLFAQKIITLSVNQPPEFGFSVEKTDTTIVKGASVELGAGMAIFGGLGEYQYVWTPSQTLSDSTVINPVAIPGDTTTYILTVSDSNGCSFSVGYTVNVHEGTVNVPPVPVAGKLQAVLFPNPNRGVFKIKLTGEAASRIDLLLYSGTGELISRQIIHQFTGGHTESFQLPLTSGVYTLKIVAGDETISCRFVIS